MAMTGVPDFWLSRWKIGGAERVAAHGEGISRGCQKAGVGHADERQDRHHGHNVDPDLIGESPCRIDDGSSRPRQRADSNHPDHHEYDCRIDQHHQTEAPQDSPGDIAVRVVHFFSDAGDLGHSGIGDEDDPGGEEQPGGALIEKAVEGSRVDSR